jgi:hypothetical protein
MLGKYLHPLWLMCLFPHRDVPEDVLNAFCWIHSTYTIPRALFKRVGLDVPSPGVDHTRNYLPEDRKFAKYYQWVGFTLFVQVNYSALLDEFLLLISEVHGSSLGRVRDLHH